MVRQYKIHLDLDGENNKVWDVTNGKVRFYQPSNLGLDVTNSIWQSNGVGIMGTRSVKQPQIEFKLETFGDSVKENYELITSFIQDILSRKFVTLEYQTENFQVYADIALSNVTKTEGYGKNGTFSETITFDIITKWYTYEELSLILIANGQVSAKSKIYGGYKGSETALQNYNRLKASPSLNLPNLNLLDGTKYFSGTWTNSDSWTTDGTYKGLTVKKRTGQWNGIYKTFTAPQDGNYTFSAYIKSSGNTAYIYRFGSINGVDNANLFKDIGNNFDWNRDSVTINLKANDTVYVKYEISGNGADSILWTAGHKWELWVPATNYLPTSSEITTNDISKYFGYNYIKNQAYTYYGETNIERLTRWDIQTDIFSIVGKFVPQSGKSEYGVKFLDDIGNEYTAIVMKPETKPDYIMINTDVNDEFYQSWTGIISLNLFPVLDFQRYRTREIKKGQMVMVNLTEAQLRIKRKVDFI